MDIFQVSCLMELANFTFPPPTDELIANFGGTLSAAGTEVEGVWEGIEADKEVWNPIETVEEVWNIIEAAEEVWNAIKAAAGVF
ncbi:hypothetical protein QYF36_015463 [Acer negundo]|nr:hypothetical protein QYF36_015463 [Acer negundo]